VRVWGLTGNIACGKSAVERRLQARGVPVIDADVVARFVVQPGQPALAAIAERWPTVLADDGTLDRPALGAIVFADPDARKQLEAITHPRIFEETARRIAGFAEQGHGVAVVSAALMVESGSWRNYAGIAVVTCPADEQLRRLMARDGVDEGAARARIDSQMPQADKVALATVVIDNGGPPEATDAQVDAWIDAHLTPETVAIPGSLGSGAQTS
jgi:dephospho-CoA kinase